MSDLIANSIIDFAIAAPKVDTYRPEAERILDGAPLHSIQNFFTDGSGQFSAGLWESTPGRWRVRYSEYEFCHLLEGQVRISNESRQWDFGPGSTFVIPAGFEGTWEVLAFARKLYVAFERAGS